MVSISAERIYPPVSENSVEPHGCVRRSLTVDGRSWQYLETGKPQGQPFMFCHGWFVSDARGVSPYGSALAEQGNYRVIMPEIPGFRGTDKLEEPTLENMASELNKFMRSTTDENVIVGGVSMGATLAVELAAKYPDKVSALVLHNPMTHWTEMNLFFYLMARLSPNTLIKLAKLPPRVKHITEDIPTLKSMVQAVGNDMKEQLRKLECPVIVINGDRDPIAMGHKNSYLARHVNPQKFFYHLLAGGHDLITKSPHQVAATVHKSLSSLTI